MHGSFPMKKPSVGLWLRTAGAVLIGCVALTLLGWSPGRPEVVVEIRTDGGVDGELFYAAKGQEHSPERRIPFVLKADGKWHTYHIGLPRAVDLERLRIDPGSSTGTVAIRSISVEGSSRRVRLTDDALVGAQHAANLVTRVPTEPERSPYLLLTAAAPDPYIDFRLPTQERGFPSAGLIGPWLKAVAALALAWLAVGELLRLLLRWGRGRFRLPRLFERAATWASDPAVLVVPPRAVALTGAVICCAMLYVALNLHQSSIGVWENLFAATPIEQTVDLGTPRQIRSDEWNTQTPWILNQVARGNHISNLGVGGEDAPLLASVPVWHSSAIAQVKFYGFHLFEVETGFSWWWAYKSFGMLLAFLWLFLVLTKGDVAASALGAAWVYGSSATQWWFSSSLPELLIAFAVATVGGIYLLFARRRLLIAIGAVLIGYGVLNLLLHLYPAFILPLAYLGAIILLGLSLEPKRMADFAHHLRWRVVCAALASVATGLLVADYLLDAMPSIRVMTDTIYPGHRVAASGDMSFTRMLYGFFEVFRVGENRLPLPPTNGSEASSFVVLVPLVLFAIPLLALGKRRNALISLLTLYCLIVGLWICVQLPGPVEGAMQALGWSWAPPIRALLGLGIASIVAVTLLFSRARADDLDLRSSKVRRFIPGAVFCAVAALGWSLKGLDPAFFSDKLIVLGALASALVTAGVVTGRTAFFAVGLTLFLMPAMMVNPLVSGLSSIQEKPILLAARQSSEVDSDRWAVVGAFVLSQGLKSQGLEVVTGSQIIPRRDMAEVLDPESRSVEVWNRYAHVMLESKPGLDNPEYELLAPDLYVVRLDICGPELPALGVTRIAYSQPAPAADLGCLEPLHAPANSGVQLFRLATGPDIPSGVPITSGRK